MWVDGAQLDQTRKVVFSIKYGDQDEEEWSLQSA
jgi:hypothetical protein